MAGTLSGKILRLDQDIPVLDRSGIYEILGDSVRQLEVMPELPEIDNDEDQDITELVAMPEVAVDLDKHFLKKPRYRSEIRNLLACQGGSCPGTPSSLNVIQLLGKSAQGLLVFPKLVPWYILARVHSQAQYRDWILQIIKGLMSLHSAGIIHRDLRIDNLVFSADGMESRDHRS